MPQALRVEAPADADDEIDLGDVKTPQVVVVTHAGRSSFARPGDALVRVDDGFGYLGRGYISGWGGWDSLRTLREKGVRVRRLRPGEQVVITEGR